MKIPFKGIKFLIIVLVLYIILLLSDTTHALSALQKAGSILLSLLPLFLLTIAEPSTVLPLMVHHFSDSVIIVGIFASLLRGGAIMVQLYAAFHAQAYKRVLPYLGKVFFFRFISWFMIAPVASMIS